MEMTISYWTRGRGSNPSLIWRIIQRLGNTNNFPTKINFSKTWYFCELNDFAIFVIFHVLPQSSGSGVFLLRISQFSVRISPDQPFCSPDQLPDGFFRMTDVGCMRMKHSQMSVVEKSGSAILQSGSASGWIFPVGCMKIKNSQMSVLEKECWPGTAVGQW